MNKLGHFKLSAVAVAVALVSACGGGGSSSSKSADTSVGVITGFGSIYVNGVEYETSKITPVVDGVPRAETTLGVGDVVTITGTVNADGVTGTATSVRCDDELEGYVLAINLQADGTGTLNVMGQTVTITLDTVFEGDTLAAITDLSVNDIVEVSGFSSGTGLVTATRIETKSAADDVEVKGLVSELDTGLQTFKLGALTVDYSAAGEVPQNLADGLYVEVKTDKALTGDVGSGFTLYASKVEIEDDGDMELEGDEGEEVKMQGIVSDITATSFRFNGALVEFSTLETDDEFDLSSLTEGQLITVEGYFNKDGQFVVTEIEDEHESEDEAEGTVTAVGDSTVTIVSGNNQLTFTVTTTTRMMDEQQSTNLHYFSLADVSVGDFVKIEFYVDDTSGDNIATELERDDLPK